MQQLGGDLYLRTAECVGSQVEEAPECQELDQVEDLEHSEQ